MTRIITVFNTCLLAITVSLGNGVAQEVDKMFFDSVDGFLSTVVKDGKVDYAALEKDGRLAELVSQISQADVSQVDKDTQLAFHINAYNLLVIAQIVEAYPLSSVMDVPGFFDGKKITVASEEQTLNDFEKKILEVYPDPRLHFALVCGALGCPPITDFAYRPDQLDNQLYLQTRAAINDEYFVSEKEGTVTISKIFQWYKKDFVEKDESIIDYLNKFSMIPISRAAKVTYGQYDWNLNGISRGLASSSSNNAFRYVVSSTIPKGAVELKIFNNLYSQQTGSSGDLTNRSSFFTTSLSAFYGLSHRFNIGLSARYRKVRNNPLPSSPFTVFGSGDGGSHRSGLTALGPQIRWAPVPQWSNFSVQSAFVFPLGEDLTGSTGSQPYIDWDGATWVTQFFNDFSIGEQFSLFTELDLWIEDIGKESEGRINRVSTPATLIFSYIPTNKLIFYGLTSYAPYWQEAYDYFFQVGAGTKYQFTPSFEVELLYTDFSNKFLNESGGKAQTFNLGLRLNF